jgi:cytochrome c-type biogenesis protein CcmH/NrfF
MQSNRYLVVAAIIAAAVGMGGGWWAAQPHGHLTQFERLGAEVGCQCGTCPLRPIATCGCAFADGMLAELAGLTDGSQSDAQIMTTLVTRYNPSVRIKPAATGVGLLAWVAPMILLTVGAVGVGAALLRWTASDGQEADANSGGPATANVGAPGDAGEARAIVERELADLGD